jgi:2'-5' RNA ligase
MMFSKQRLFFALWPDATTRQTLLATMEPLRPPLKAQWIRAANLHITLAFLGEVGAERVGLVHAAADAVQLPPVALQLDTLTHWRKPQILCLCPSTPAPSVEQLARHLAESLQAAGFALEKRPYRPHLTLARKVTTWPADVSLAQPINWQAQEFVLVESTQDNRGTVYTVLRRWPLAA